MMAPHRVRHSPFDLKVLDGLPKSAPLRLPAKYVSSTQILRVVEDRLQAGRRLAVVHDEEDLDAVTIVPQTRSESFGFVAAAVLKAPRRLHTRIFAAERPRAAQLLEPFHPSV